MKRIVTLILALLLVGGCTAQRNDVPGGLSVTESAAAAAARAGYDQFLAALAENGWPILDDDKLSGSVNGVQSIVQNCRVWLRVTSADPFSYGIDSINGHATSDVFGAEIGKVLTKPNITRGDFEDAYKGVSKNSSC